MCFESCADECATVQFCHGVTFRFHFYCSMRRECPPMNAHLLRLVQVSYLTVYCTINVMLMCHSYEFPKAALLLLVLW